MLKITSILLFLFASVSLLAQDLQTVLGKAYSSEDSSAYYFQKAKRMIKTESERGQYLFCKNAHHLDYGDSDSSVYYGNQAIKKLREVKDYNSLFTVYNNLNKLYKKQGQYDKGIAYLFKGLKEAEQLDKSKKWVRYFNTQLSVNYHDFENFERGVFYGKKALDMYLKDPKSDPGFICDALNAIAINYDDWNKPDLALKYHKMVFNYIKGKDTLTITSTYNNIGNTLLKQKKYKEAESWINRAVVITDLTKEGNPYFDYEHATHYTNLAAIASALGDYQKAEMLLKKAYEHTQKSGNAEKMRDYYYQSFQFNKKRRNFEKTIEDQEMYIKLRDSLYHSDRAKAVVDIEAKYQNEKKEKELLQTKNKLIQQEMESQRKRNWLIIALLVALSFIAAGVLLLRQQKLKNKQQEQEFELKNAIASIETQNKLQKQRLAISRDLHDNIGAQLTFIISSIENLKYGFSIDDEKLKNKLSGISSFTRDTITELRDTIWAMNKNEITIEDLESRIVNFIEQAKHALHDIQFRFVNYITFAKTKTFLSRDGMNVYRIIQEAVNNAVKHSKASEIEVCINELNDTIEVLITDNGYGFNLEDTNAGNGLSSMQKRATELGSALEIKSSKDGTVISFLFTN